MKKVFPKMYALTKLGKVKWYLVEVISENSQKATMKCSTATSLTAKVQTNDYVYTEGKNIGRANETTPLQQAMAEAESTIRKLRDEGYNETIPDVSDKFNTDATGSPKPMLAKKYSSWKWKRVLVQPKLDGIRCFCRKIRGKIVLTTRSGKYVTTLPHIEEALKDMPENIVLDGELYIHGMSLQNTISAIKKINENTINVKYRIYDLAIPNIIQQFRHEQLQELLKEFDSNLISGVPTYEVHTEKEMLELFVQFLQDGFEGAMIRVPDGVYEFGFRSSSLIKYKEFLDDEFKIVFVEEATGRDAGTAVFRCTKDEAAYKMFMNNGQLLQDQKWLKEYTFTCRPKGTHEQRTVYYKSRKQLIGKDLTVKYQTLSDNSIPIFPVGIAVRDYE